MGGTEFFSNVYYAVSSTVVGYSSVFILMTMESMVFLPVPSEAVMPFAGFLIGRGKHVSFGGVLVIRYAGQYFRVAYIVLCRVLRRCAVCS